MQEVLHAIADKHRKLPKRPQLVGLHGRVPPPCLVALMKDCWHPVSTPPPLPPSPVLAIMYLLWVFALVASTRLSLSCIVKGERCEVNRQCNFPYQDLFVLMALDQSLVLLYALFVCIFTVRSTCSIICTIIATAVVLISSFSPAALSPPSVPHPPLPTPTPPLCWARPH